jgi:molybdenum cofactor sulfurtransferase
MKWMILLDAAALVSSASLDLSQYQPDFVTLSFYKIFGFPTGIGALIVKNCKRTFHFFV